MRKLLWGCIAAGALWSQQAAAVNTDGYQIPYVDSSFIFEIPDSVRHSDNGIGFQVGGGWPLTDHSAIELNYYSLRRSRNIDGRNDYQDGVFPQYVYDFGLFGFKQDYLPNFKPYVLGGPGYVRDDAFGAAHNHVAVDAGGGLLFPLHVGNWDWGWAVRTQADLIGSLNRGNATYNSGAATLWDWHLSIGVQIPLTPFFRPHQAPPPVAKECATTVVNPVTGRTDCVADSDGDGVPDNLDQCPGTPPGTKVDDKGCPIGTQDSDGDGVPDSADQCPDTPTGAKVDAQGCALEQTLVHQDVNFESGSAVLTGQATHVLDRIAAAMRGQKNIHLEIDGYTDNTSTAKFNMVLSQQRAESVKQYLIGQGIDATRMSTQGFGDTHPMVSNNDEAGRAVNRRVEFKISLH
jgi:OmpA-OmpF porin, OOP family